MWMKKKQKDCLKNCHFIMLQLKNNTLNVLILDLLRELPFHHKLIIVKTSKAFKGYAKSYNIEIRLISLTDN